MTRPDLFDERAHLGHGPAALDPAREAALAASDRAILEALPPGMVAAEVERRLAQRRRARATRRARAVAFAAAAATAAVLIVAFGRREPARRGDPMEELDTGAGNRVKGDPRLVVFRQRGDAIEELGRGERARAGDLLQISYVAAGRRFGVIVSIDGRGAVTRHLPAEGDAAVALAAGGAVALDRAYELDDAPGFERFVLITAAERFALDDVLAAARAVAAHPAARRAPLALPPRFEQHDFLLRKD